MCDVCICVLCCWLGFFFSLTSEYSIWFILDGFHKVVSIEGGGLKVEKDEMEFAHQFFMMGHPYLLEHIKRKVRDLDMLQGYGV